MKKHYAVKMIGLQNIQTIIIIFLLGNEMKTSNFLDNNANHSQIKNTQQTKSVE